MDPQVEICCKKSRKIKCCIDLVIYILSILISFVIGLLVGALTEIVGFLTIGAIIVLLVELILLVIIRIITLLCCQRKC